MALYMLPSQAVILSSLLTPKLYDEHFLPIKLMRVPVLDINTQLADIQEPRYMAELCPFRSDELACVHSYRRSWSRAFSD